MKILLYLSVLIVMVSGLYADNDIYSIKQEIITKSGQIIRIVSDRDTYNSETETYSYRKLVSIGNSPENIETYSFILPELEFFPVDPYFFGEFLDKDKTLLIIQTMKCFYIFDLQSNQLSRLICPGRDKPWLGVDGRSGNLIGPVFDESGTTLRGKIVHQGIFVYDIKNPAIPVEINYTADFNIE
ncbi:MAG: hypothetical protein L3J12_07645 [Spirochaetales bacterium]|nr:hypothetical protein [Spirochaetales bacterium]